MTEREEGLQRLLVGDLDPDSDEARRFFAEHPGAREELESMMRLEVAIREVGRERDEVVAAAMAAPEPTGLEAERFVAERLARTRAAPQRAPFRFLPWAGALAAAAGLTLYLGGPWTPATGGPGGAPDRGPVLGTGLVLLAPVSEAGQIAELRWEYELEQGQYFRVAVYDPGEPFDPVATSPELQEHSWRPDPADVARWPDPFTWQVQVLAGGGVELERSAQARRSP